MNRLQLCQRLRSEAGLGGSGPSATTAQTGEMLQVVEWVDEAWNRIQSSRNWDWLWEATTVVVTSGTGATTGSIPASRYIKDATFDANGSPLTYMEWADFRTAYPSALIVAGNPRVWTIRPDKAFAVNAKPSTNTTYSVERYKNPTAMSTDGGSPTGLPTEHHMLIVWRALMLYAGYDEAGDQYRRAETEYKKVLSNMGVTDRAEIRWGSGW